MRVLILGGTGFSGPHIARGLSELGHLVTVFHRGRTRADLPAGVREVLGDTADLPAELRRLQPDVVIHMWAFTEDDAKRFLEVFRGHAGRAVVISSCEVYRAYGKLHLAEAGPPDPIPLDEDAPLRESRYLYRDRKDLSIDTTFYDKVLVEQALIAQSGLPVTILRYPGVYGPHDPYRRFQSWLDQMAAGDEIRIAEDYAAWRWTSGYVEDVATAAVLAATQDRAAGRIYNVGALHSPTTAEIIEELGRASGWQGRVLAVPPSEIPEEQRSPHPHDFSHHIAIDTGRIRGELGYREIVPRDEGLRRTIQWERALRDSASGSQ